MPELKAQPTPESPDDSTAPATKPATRNPIIRWLLVLAWIVFILTTLLAFPSHLTVLTAAITLAIFGCLLFQQTSQAAWVVVVAGAILIAKTPSIQIDFILMVVAFLASGIIYFWGASKLQWAALGITVVAVTFFGIKRTLDAKGGYPAELQKMVTQPVLNFGRNGYTTQMAIDDLLPKILDAKPQLVVMELGGHDYKDGEPRDQTKARLRQIIQELTDADIEVVIVEIIHGLISDPFYGVERELAAEFDLQLIPDTIIRRFVYFSEIIPPGRWMDQSEHLSEDGLHPNARGQVEFAKVVADAIRVGD